MNVLIIPEDFRKDQYLLKPLIVGILADLGKPRARVSVCNNPLMGGVTQSLKSDRIKHVVDLYKMVDLFVLCVDRDGVQNRRTRLDQLEAEFGVGRVFLAENAWEA